MWSTPFSAPLMQARGKDRRQIKSPSTFTNCLLPCCFQAPPHLAHSFFCTTQYGERHTSFSSTPPGLKKIPTHASVRYMVVGGSSREG